jgi:hypothetical protein
MFSKQDYERHDSRSLAPGMIHLKGQENFEVWDFKTMSALSSIDVEYVLNESDPNATEDRLQVPLAPHELLVRQQVALQRAQRALDAHHRNQGRQGAPPVADPAGLPDITGVTRVETDRERSDRCTKFTKDLKKAYNTIVSSLLDGPLAVARGAEKGNGRELYELLCERYRSNTSSTCVALIKRCFDYVQTGPIADHVTGWLNLMRQLENAKVPLAPSLEAVMFLRTLKPEFNTVLPRPE